MAGIPDNALQKVEGVMEELLVKIIVTKSVMPINYIREEAESLRQATLFVTRWLIIGNVKIMKPVYILLSSAMGSLTAGMTLMKQIFFVMPVTVPLKTCLPANIDSIPTKLYAL